MLNTGYTEEEIKHYFSEYLSKVAQALSMTKEGVMDNLRRNYNGFCFDEEAATSVYCPWSVLNLFNRPKKGFQNYWYTSGGQPTVLMRYLSNHALSEPISYSENKMIRLSDLNASRQYEEINLDVLLTQAGYLTIRSVMKNGYVVLGYPNQEVATSMAQLYSDELLKGKPLEQPKEPLISDILSNGNTQEVVEAFNRAVSAIDYHRYPITDESSCRAYLQVLLIGAAMLPHVEVHNALGRSDMEVQTGNRLWVFEFKYAKDDSKVDTLLNEGVKQMETLRYGEQHPTQEIKRVALVFSGTKRMFVAWKQV